MRSSHLIAFFALWAVTTSTLVYVLTLRDPITHAVVSMAMGLLALWVGIGGALSWRLRERLKVLFARLPGPWQAKFVGFCTLLALVEEAVTTTMTNLAPLFGVPVGRAYITASASYLDVVLCHSVVVFVPMFAAWAWMLSRWRFHPNAVFILFGLTGTLAEATTFGLQNLGAAGFWVMVYGLMVYLPAYSVPADRPARDPRPRHFLVALLLPPLWVPLTAWPLWLSDHPRTHFPPIQP